MTKRFSTIFFGLFFITVTLLLNTLTIRNNQRHISNLHRQITELKLQQEINYENK